jgi:hypothetical protein
MMSFQELNSFGSFDAPEERHFLDASGSYPNSQLSNDDDKDSLIFVDNGQQERG